MGHSATQLAWPLKNDNNVIKNKDGRTVLDLKE